MPRDDRLVIASVLAPPTGARFTVLGLLCSMAFVLYLDRVCIAQALKPMKEEFGWSNTQASLVLMAFTLAYGIFEIPTGRLGDSHGSRGVLTRIVLWWSCFTALTGAIGSFAYVAWVGSFPLVFNTLTVLVLIRFLFGAGEAGAIPNAARIMLHWFPDSERGRIQGWFQASMHIGGTLAPIVAAAIIVRSSWRWTFVIFGIVGVVWAAVFYWWFRDSPREHPSVNRAEANAIGTPPGQALAHAPLPWRDVLTHPNVWLLSVIIILSAFNSYLFFSWYSTYLQEARRVSNETAGYLAGLALGGATLGSVLGGYLSDWISRRTGDRYRSRRWVCLYSYASSAACIFASIHVDVPLLSASLCALGCLLMFLQLPIWWACAFELSGQHPGALFGLLNGTGVVGAMGSQFFFGAFADWRQSAGYSGRAQWDPAFYVCVVTLLTAGVLWQFIQKRRAIGEAEVKPVIVDNFTERRG